MINVRDLARDLRLAGRAHQNCMLCIDGLGGQFLSIAAQLTEIVGALYDVVEHELSPGLTSTGPKRCTIESPQQQEQSS